MSQKTLPGTPESEYNKRHGQQFKTKSFPDQDRYHSNNTDTSREPTSRGTKIKALRLQNETLRKELAYDHKLLDQLGVSVN